MDSEIPISSITPCDPADCPVPLPVGNELLAALRMESLKLENQIQAISEAELQKYSTLCFNAQAVLARLRKLENPTKESVHELTETLWAKFMVLDRRDTRQVYYTQSKGISNAKDGS